MLWGCFGMAVLCHAALGDASMSSSGNCEHCERDFSYSLIHNRFNDSAFAYCDKCGRTATFSAWSKKPKEAVFQQGTLSSHLESFVAPCECGGKFRSDASPRCPHCNEPLSAELGATYIERNAPGTAKGWRWQRNWKGLYSIVIEGQSAKDPWDPARL